MLRGKNVIITGANRGIGHTLLVMLAKSGANIWACCRKSNSSFEEEIACLAAENRVWIKPVYFELTDSNSIERGLQCIIADRQSIDVLVNNAGVTATALLHQTSIEEIKEIFEVNYFSLLTIVKRISKVMIRQKSGSIVNMASVAGMEHQPGRVAYGSSKAAVIWMTQALAKEFGPFGVRINAVAPGAIKTEMIAEYSEEKINLNSLRLSPCSPERICLDGISGYIEPRQVRMLRTSWATRFLSPLSDQTVFKISVVAMPAARIPLAGEMECFAMQCRTSKDFGVR